jgi:5-formaminoimidazole-4-carboxamide-1-(beta)-D-ribofuranosyl 5'-monophosphate synthetase
MVPEEIVNPNLAGYDLEDLTVATICSHSALQIFHGAKQEGLKTLGITKADRQEMYDSFPMSRPDDFLVVNDFKELLAPSFQRELMDQNVLLIPHGSMVEYVGSEAVGNMLEVPMFGNPKVLDWESNRSKEREWLEKAGCKMPRLFRSPADIREPCFVKLPGAKGGKGFRIVASEEEFRQVVEQTPGLEDDEFTVQEFIIGTRYYFQMYYSPIHKDGYTAGEGRVELLGIDRRVESNIDELYRFGFSRYELAKADIERTFVVTGNLPLVLRESMLPRIFEMSRDIVNVSLDLFYPGIVGPFCVETVLTDDLEFYVFEISARIVAGSNLYPLGSQYTEFMFGEPMSTGRRLSRDINIARKRGELHKIVF